MPSCCAEVQLYILVGGVLGFLSGVVGLSATRAMDVLCQLVLLAVLWV
jgi:hypothetical protein